MNTKHPYNEEYLNNINIHQILCGDYPPNTFPPDVERQLADIGNRKPVRHLEVVKDKSGRVF